MCAAPNAAAPPPAAAPPRLRVASFNVLAQSYARKSAFPYAAAGALDWEHRRQRLFEAVRGASADVVALQEADPVEEWDAFFEREGYDVFHAPRPARRGWQARDRCVVAWRRKRLALAAAGPPPEAVDLNLSDLDGSSPSDRSRLNKDNQGVLVALEDRAAGTLLVAASVHLHWNPAFPDVKLRQAAFFAREAARFRSEAGAAAALFVCGDLNSTPGSDVYRYLVTGRRPAQHLAGVEAVPDAVRPLVAAGMTSPPPPAPPRRLAVQRALKRSARALRRLGCDVEVFDEPRGREDLAAFFARLRGEGRLLVTQNGKMTVRRGCPDHLLLPPRIDSAQALLEVSRHLGLHERAEHNDRDVKGVLERYCGCGGRSAPLSQAEAALLPFVRDEVRSGTLPSGEQVRFTKCQECGRVTWWTRANTSARVSRLMSAVEYEPRLEVLERLPRGGDAAAAAATASAAATGPGLWEWEPEGRGGWRPLSSVASARLDGARRDGASLVRLTVNIKRGHYGLPRTFEVDLEAGTYTLVEAAAPAGGGDGARPPDSRPLRFRRRAGAGAQRAAPRPAAAAAAAAPEASAGKCLSTAAAPPRGHVDELFLEPGEWNDLLGLRSAYGSYRAAAAAAGHDGAGEPSARARLLPAAAEDGPPPDPGAGRGEPAWTNATASFSGTLDYVLFSAGRGAPFPRLAALGALPGGGGVLLPSRAWPSDHCLLVAEFETAP